MGDDIKELEQYSIESIHEKTRIAHENIKKLIAEDFKAFQKVQFLGFVSILEREYGLDLNGYREAYFNAMGTQQSETPQPEAFITPKEPSKNRYIVIALFLIAAVLIGAYFLLSSPKEQNSERVEINDSVIVGAKEKLEVLNAQKEQEAAEQNLSNEENLTVPVEKIEPEVVAPPQVVIIPKRRVWMGLIAQPDGKRIQKIIESPYELNTSKEWLMVFGHGQIDIEEGKTLLEYSDRRKLWFIFEGGKLEKIDKEQFKLRNQGRTW